MGGSSSKVANSAISATKRKLPTTTPSTSSATLHKRSPISPASTPPPSSTTGDANAKGTRPNIAQPGPTVHPSLSTPAAAPSSSRNEFIDLDARDPQFSSRLSSLGAVQPVSTGSNSSTFSPNATSKPPGTREDLSHSGGRHLSGPGQVFPSPETNPALLVIEARERVRRRAESEAEDMGRKGFSGRTVVDAGTLGAIVRARDQKGQMDEQVEGRWRLRKGILGETLGDRGQVFKGVI